MATSTRFGVEIRQRLTSNLLTIDAGDFFTFTPGICLLITDGPMKALAEEIAEEIKNRVRRQIAAKRSRVNYDGRIACATTTVLLSIVKSIDK